MRLTVVLLLVILSTLFVGCASDVSDSGDIVDEEVEMTEEEADESDAGLIDETEDIDVGEMI